MEDEAIKNTKRLRNKVKTLLKKPQYAQRTPEWFKQRQTRVTASEAASCLFKSKNVCETYAKEFNISNFKYKEHEPLNPYETKEDYIIKKCSAFYGVAVFKDNPFTLWGKKYEDVANRIYQRLTNTVVKEFGLISHSRLRWVAASPDGITEDGVMLEIKCPKSRKIDESAPPLYYWVQTQIQLEVCDLDYCDFLECEIEEVQNEQEFKQIVLGPKQDFGIILQIANSGPDPKFVYPPLHLNTTDEYIVWKNACLESDPTAFIPIYFYITKYNVIRIKRSKEWFDNVKSDIKSTWEIITKLQANKSDFEKYKESIHLLKSKAFIEKWHTTECMIHSNDESDMVFDSEAPVPSVVESERENASKLCLIDSSDEF